MAKKLIRVVIEMDPAKVPEVSFDRVLMTELLAVKAEVTEAYWKARDSRRKEKKP